jgi:hypothetical protein
MSRVNKALRRRECDKLKAERDKAVTENMASQVLKFKFR